MDTFEPVSECYRNGCARMCTYVQSVRFPAFIVQPCAAMCTRIGDGVGDMFRQRKGGLHVTSNPCFHRLNQQNARDHADHARSFVSKG